MYVGNLKLTLKTIEQTKIGKKIGIIKTNCFHHSCEKLGRKRIYSLIY